jgi:phage gp36-like protein
VAYATKEDLALQMPGITLAQLSNDVDPTTTDDTVIDRMIEDAESSVDSFCRGKHTLPFDPVPKKVRKWTVTLAEVNLYGRRPDLLLPPATKAKFELVMTELRGIRDNKILIDDPDSSANTASYYKLNKSISQPIFKTTAEKTGRLDRFFAPRDGFDT